MMLFRDGWTYGMSPDYRGPEVPPPASERDRIALQRRYWQRRLEIVTLERNRLYDAVGNLHLARQTRSAPLQQVVHAINQQGYRDSSCWERGLADWGRNFCALQMLPLAECETGVGTVD